MRWLRFPPVAGAMLLLGLLAAGPAAAQQGPDHLHVDLSLVSCGTVKATGYHLPANTRLDLRFQDAATGATLRQASIPMGADGALDLSVTLPLTKVRTVRMTVSRPGAAKPFAFSEMSIPGACPLPFTGPARGPALAGTGALLLAGGTLLVAATAYRGRHHRRRAAA
jgi:hypothetical protein